MHLLNKQVCILLGSVPPAFWPYPVVLSVSWLWGGVVCLLRGGGGRGVCLLGGDLPSEGGASLPALCHCGKADPPPPMNKMTHRCKNITFPQLRLPACENDNQLPLPMQSVWSQYQWRIQDFPQVGAWTLWGGGGGVNTQFCILPKTAWNWKNLDAQGGRAYLTPPLRSATEYDFTVGFLNIFTLRNITSNHR